MLPGPEFVFRPVNEKSWAKSGKSPANLHIKRKTASSRRVNKIVNNFFSSSLSACHYSKSRKFFQKISSAPFLPLLTKFGHNSAINSSGQISFSPAPFELFGRNFGHLATLRVKEIYGDLTGKPVYNPNQTTFLQGGLPRRLIDSYFIFFNKCLSWERNRYFYENHF